MEWLSQLARRLIALARRNQFDRDLHDEMRLHRELREQESLESDMATDEAYYAARRRFGNEKILKEMSREMWRWNSLETLPQDVHYTLRQLRRNLGFTAVAALTSEPTNGRLTPSNGDRLAYVRPHLMNIERHPHQPNPLAVRVKHINSAGPLVKAELATERGDHSTWRSHTSALKSLY